MEVWKWVWTGGRVTTIGTRLANGRLFGGWIREMVMAKVCSGRWLRTLCRCRKIVHASAAASLGWLANVQGLVSTKRGSCLAGKRKTKGCEMRIRVS